MAWRKLPRALFVTYGDNSGAFVPAPVKGRRFRHAAQVNQIRQATAPAATTAANIVHDINESCDASAARAGGDAQDPLYDA
jgi:hypothetical protein